MEYRQRSPIQGNKAIIEHILKNFRMPKGFEEFIYLSQVLQALSIKAGVEHWRRIKPFCMGTIYWQLNDIWQGSSWSSLEYSGRWKLLQYFAKNFFDPALISITEENGKIHVWLTCDLATYKAPFFEAKLKLSIWSFEGALLRSGEYQCGIPSTSSKIVLTADIKAEILSNGQTSRQKCFIIVNMKGLKGEEGTAIFPLCSLKEVKLKKSKYELKLKSSSNQTITFSITSDTVAPYVFLSTELHGNFSDNGFWLLPGKENLITFKSFTSQLKLNDEVTKFMTSLKIMSLRDSY